MVLFPFLRRKDLRLLSHERWEFGNADYYRLISREAAAGKVAVAVANLSPIAEKTKHGRAFYIGLFLLWLLIATISWFTYILS